MTVTDGARDPFAGPSPAMTSIDDTVGFLRALDHARSGALIELRYRRQNGMARCFVDAADPEQAARIACALGGRTDVYVGVLARTRRQGTRDAVDEAWVAWADCDSATSARRLEDFEPPASILVDSGSQHGQHAYWLLNRPLRPVAIEQVNRCLAAALSADPASTDAARILRPPATSNWKYHPAGAVVLTRCEGERVDPRRLIRRLPTDVPRHRSTTSARVGTDALSSIGPYDYVTRLLSVELGHDGKVCCPFHADRTPSLHVYESAERGWYCFGCRRGGTIYDLAATLWGMQPRGEEFLELRTRLREVFDVR